MTIMAACHTLVHIGAGDTVASEADIAHTTERTRKVDAGCVSMAIMAAFLALVDVSTTCSVSAKSWNARTAERADLIGTGGVVVTRVCISHTLVNVHAGHAITFKAFKACTRESWQTITASRIDMTRGTAFRTLVDIWKGKKNEKWCNFVHKALIISKRANWRPPHKWCTILTGGQWGESPQAKKKDRWVSLHGGSQPFAQAQGTNKKKKREKRRAAFLVSLGKKTLLAVQRSLCRKRERFKVMKKKKELWRVEQLCSQEENNKKKKVVSWVSTRWCPREIRLVEGRTRHQCRTEKLWLYTLTYQRISWDFLSSLNHTLRCWQRYLKLERNHSTTPYLTSAKIINRERVWTFQITWVVQKKEQTKERKTKLRGILAWVIFFPQCFERAYQTEWSYMVTHRGTKTLEVLKCIFRTFKQQPTISQIDLSVNSTQFLSLTVSRTYR